MQLLVSVRSAAEAKAAIAGGADVVDAKEPDAGALGAVSIDVLREIAAVVHADVPLSAAIGDASDDAIVERTACAFAAAGVGFVKVGFAGVTSEARVAAFASAAQRGVAAGSGARCGVVLVGYADADPSASVTAAALVEIAARTGARGVLLDTAQKNGRGLRALFDRDTLRAFVARAHTAGLFAALAGKLTANDLPFVRDLGADIAGVRGAACEGGRTGRVTADRVRILRALSARDGLQAVPSESAEWEARPEGRALPRNASASIRSAATIVASTPGGSARWK